MSIGQRLKSLRLSSEMSLRAVAEIIGVQHGSVAKWENDTNNIKRRHLEALAKIFDVSEQWLMFGDEHEQIPSSFLRQNSLQTRFDGLEDEDKAFLLDFLNRYIAGKKNKKNKKSGRASSKKSN